jgi:RimJ/RimL family protein N-acetyltransferase
MTPNIFLRELERSDVAIINAWRADHDLVARLGAPFRHVSCEVEDRWYDTYLASRSQNIRLAICEKNAKEKIIGVGYLLNIDWVNRTAEFGIQIGESAKRNRGLGTTAGRLILHHAFFDQNLRRIMSFILATNLPSLKLHEKLGFQQEGVFRQAIFKEGKYEDAVSMAIFAEDFKSE